MSIGVTHHPSGSARRRWRWYHGMAFYAIVQGLTFGLNGLTNTLRGRKGRNIRDTLLGDVSYFQELRQAAIAPPSWMFGPAWTVNNICAIWGLLRVLDKPDGTPGREGYLALQGMTWLDYVVFNAAYFGLRSPINAFVLTAVFFGLTLASGVVAVFRLKDTAVALSLATTFVWLIVALTAATFQALWNHDDFYDVGPFATPPNALLKRKS